MLSVQRGSICDETSMRIGRVSSQTSTACVVATHIAMRARAARGLRPSIAPWPVRGSRRAISTSAINNVVIHYDDAVTMNNYDARAICFRPARVRVDNTRAAGPV